MIQRFAVAILLLGALARSAAADILSETVVTVDTRPGVTQSFALVKPANPVAAAILFPGGGGNLDLANLPKENRGNFLVRTRQRFAKLGIMVAVVDAPSDHAGSEGMPLGFRTSAEHAADMAAVANHMAGIARVPVWLVGTSRGTESATSVAIRLQDPIAGLVLTSTVTEANPKMSSVLDMALDTLKMPVLIAAHRQDGCKVTPARGADSVKGKLKNALPVQVLYFEGGAAPKAGPCEGLSAHGFYGLEAEVVDAIAKFIKGK
ncbi:MAG: alpha/beta hydrolase [Rhodospirillales bacterium]|nr:alpha/beta hydrolase [Rhodospirillales bacterium]